MISQRNPEKMKTKTLQILTIFYQKEEPKLDNNPFIVNPVKYSKTTQNFKTIEIIENYH
jgi:hypothetical protein